MDPYETRGALCRVPSRRLEDHIPRGKCFFLMVNEFYPDVSPIIPFPVAVTIR